MINGLVRSTHSSTSSSSFYTLPSSHHNIYLLFLSSPLIPTNHTYYFFSMTTMYVTPGTLYAGKPSAVFSPVTSNLQRSSSFLPYYSLRILDNNKTKSLSKSSLSSSAPRFSMRVSSKQAYICRDCGSLFQSISLSLSL